MLKLDFGRWLLGQLYCPWGFRLCPFVMKSTLTKKSKKEKKKVKEKRENKKLDDFLVI